MFVECQTKTQQSCEISHSVLSDGKKQRVTGDIWYQKPTYALLIQYNLQLKNTHRDTTQNADITSNKFNAHSI
jgi:hypothetical protein